MVQALSIRTKLIMAMLALMRSVALMGVTADDAHAGVTELRTVYNKTGKTVYLWNHENGWITTILPEGSATPFSSVGKASFNQWVPWCTWGGEFDKGKYIEVGYFENGMRVHKYSIWQENRRESDGFWRDRIRYTKYRSYVSDAQAMPGYSAVDGRRDLYLWNLDLAATSNYYTTGVRLTPGQ
jgi:hypothetical protein